MDKRLIDANAANVDEISCYYGDHCYLEDVKEWLDEQPTVDAVEVIRCRDCQMESTCKVTQRLGEDGFCSCGERIGND